MTKGRRKTYFVDWDKTVAVRNGGDSVFKSGPLIQPMVDWIHRWLSNGDKVVIFTARSGEAQIRPVRKQLEDLGLGHLEITNIKSSRADFFIDDKAKEVEPNTGEFVVDKLKEEMFEGRELLVQLANLLEGKFVTEREKRIEAKVIKWLEHADKTHWPERIGRFVCA